MLARYIGRHIPGEPNVVVQNIVGASGLVSANWLYNVAPKDGTVMATFVPTVALEPMLSMSARDTASRSPGGRGWMRGDDGLTMLFIAPYCAAVVPCVRVGCKW